MSKKKTDNPYNCPLTNAIHQIGGRWKPLILWNLGNGTRRFGQLGAIVPLISKKVLTEQLKELEKDGLISRVEHKEGAFRVDYTLTEKGQSVLPILSVMCDWGKGNLASAGLLTSQIVA